MEVKAEPLYNVPATPSVQDISNDKSEKGSEIKQILAYCFFSVAFSRRYIYFFFLGGFL